MKRNRGYSHWNPAMGLDRRSIETDTPRIFVTRESANRAIIQWFHNPNATTKITTTYFGEEDETYDSVPDGRKKDDLEVITMLFEEIPE